MANSDATESPEDQIARLEREHPRLADEKSRAEQAAKAGLAVQPPTPDRLPRRRMAIALALLQLALAFWVAGHVDVQAPGYFSKPTDAAPLLAFSVALAAYLATVRRELIKTLTGKTGGERRDRKVEAIMITGGEQATVVLGLGTVARMVLVPGPHVVYDARLLALLAVNVVYLAIVHLVEWML